MELVTNVKLSIEKVEELNDIIAAAVMASIIFGNSFNINDVDDNVIENVTYAVMSDILNVLFK